MNRGEYTTEIYDFLYLMKRYGTGMKVLDCGAGGKYPKMAILKKHGYDVTGLDNNEEAINEAKEFAEQHDIDLSFQLADIRSIPFEDNSFDGVYSYNTIFHLTKQGIQVALDEMIRVLKPSGIGFINFVHIDDGHDYGEKISEGEYIMQVDGQKIIHSLLTEEECMELFSSHANILEIQKKVIRVLTRDNTPFVFLDFFFQKK